MNSARSTVTSNQIGKRYGDSPGGKIINFRGEISFDSNYPDGTPRKRLDLTRLEKTGWEKTYSVDDGLKSTIKWFQNNIDNFRD